jgi:muramoyltetrapeptide carboxypeptidase
MVLTEVSPAGLGSALRDPAVRAVAVEADHRALDDLDVAALRVDPKPIVGIGATTMLQLELWRLCGLESVHGTALPSESVVRRETDDAVLVPGRAEGILLGGSLTAMRAMVGAGLPDLTGAIVVLDDVRLLGLGQVDRQLTHLRVAGAFDGIRGVAVGRFTGFETLVDRNWTVLDVLRDQLTSLGVPVLGGLPLGPGPGAVPIWLGRNALLDTRTGTLST